MNALLFEKITSLSSTKRTELKSNLSQSPLMLRFVTFLEQQQKENFSTVEAVCFIYEISKNDRAYSVYENRFYKLRKKLNEILRENEDVSVEKNPTEQQQMNEAKILVSTGKFKEAQVLLEKTEKLCWQNNVFELLPEVIDRLIQVNQALNTVEKNKLLHKNYAKSVELWADLMEAKNITRQIYEVNLQKGIKATEPLFNRLAKLVVKHRSYPRFKLLYNVIAAHFKVGNVAQINVINRHIAVAKKLMHQYPDMPAVQYLYDFQSSQYFRLSMVQSMLYFSALRFKEAAEEMAVLYEKVMLKKARFSGMKSEALFVNFILMLINAARFEDALKVVEDYKAFVTENRMHEKLMHVYMEMASIHSSMYPAKSKYKVDFLLEQINKYNESQPQTAQYLIHGYVIKIRLLLADHRFVEAEKELKKRDIKDVFANKEIVRYTTDVILARRMKLSETQIAVLKNDIKKAKISTTAPADYNWLSFLENLMKYA